MSVVLRHTRHSRLNYPNLYSYQRIHRRSRKISKREPLFYSILKHKNPPFSSSVLRVSIFFSREATGFLRYGHRRLLFPLFAQRRNGGAIVGHSEPQTITNNLYITEDLLACQNSNHRARAEQFAGMITVREAKRRWTSINRADFICRRRCRKDRVPFEGMGVYSEGRNCWTACPEISFYSPPKWPSVMDYCTRAHESSRIL